MSRPAREREVAELRRRFAIHASTLKPGLPCQILANGDWPYEGIVLKVGTGLARIEFQRRKGGHVTRAISFRDVYVPGALQKLRAERAAAPGPAAQEQP